MSSKRKTEVIKKINRYGLMDDMNEMYNFILWGNIYDNSLVRPFFQIEEAAFLKEDAFHGNGCRCEHETPLKVQCLRMVYSYCCRENSDVSNKLNLLSEEDLETFFGEEYGIMLLEYFNRMAGNLSGKARPNREFATIVKVCEELSNTVKSEFWEELTVKNLTELGSLDRFKNFLVRMRDEPKVGLLLKLVLRYMLECKFSSAKFWLSSVIEIILRGNNHFFQYLVASTGLMPVLLYEVIYFKEKKKSLIQLPFDILGELTKFNQGMYWLLDTHLQDTSERKEFVEKVCSEEFIVDANLMVRSVFLTEDYFVNKKVKFVSEVAENIVARKVDLVMLISGVMSKFEISQNNISCILTALIIMLIEHRRNRLTDFFAQIKKRLDNYSKWRTELKCLVK